MTILEAMKAELERQWGGKIDGDEIHCSDSDMLDLIALAQAVEKAVKR